MSRSTTRPSAAVESVAVLTYHAVVEAPEALDAWEPGARLYVFTLDEHLGVAPRVRDHGRQAGGHRLEERDRDALRLRREGEDVEEPQQARHVAAIAGEPHGVGHTQLGGDSPERRPLGPVAHEHQHRLRHPPAREREGAQQARIVLDRPQIPHCADHGGTRRDAQLGHQRRL